MTLPARIDPEQPLPDNVRRWIDAHGTQLLRALVNEIESKSLKLRDAKREIDYLKRRLRDREQVAD